MMTSYQNTNTKVGELTEEEEEEEEEKGKMEEGVQISIIRCNRIVFIQSILTESEGLYSRHRKAHGHGGDVFDLESLAKSSTDFLPRKLYIRLCEESIYLNEKSTVYGIFSVNVTYVCV